MYKLDANHLEIVRAFEQLGFKVIDNAKVKRHEAGQLDIWVGLSNPYNRRRKMGMWIFVEIKTEKGTLEPAQEKMVEDCLDRDLPVSIVHSVADVDRLYKTCLSFLRDGGAR